MNVVESRSIAFIRIERMEIREIASRIAPRRHGSKYRGRKIAGFPALLGYCVLEISTPLRSHSYESPSFEYRARSSRGSTHDLCIRGLIRVVCNATTVRGPYFLQPRRANYFRAPLVTGSGPDKSGLIDPRIGHRILYFNVIDGGRTEGGLCV